MAAVTRGRTSEPAPSAPMTTPAVISRPVEKRRRWHSRSPVAGDGDEPLVPVDRSRHQRIDQQLPQRRSINFRPRHRGFGFNLLPENTAVFRHDSDVLSLGPCERLELLQQLGHSQRPLAGLDVQVKRSTLSAGVGRRVASRLSHQLARMEARSLITKGQQGPNGSEVRLDPPPTQSLKSPKSLHRNREAKVTSAIPARSGKSDCEATQSACGAVQLRIFPGLSRPCESKRRFSSTTAGLSCPCLPSSRMKTCGLLMVTPWSR